MALLAGVVAGIVWQARGESHARHAAPSAASENDGPRLAWPVAALGWSFLGALWGAWLWVISSASWRGLALLVLAALPALGWMRQPPHRRKLAMLLGAYACITLGMVAIIFWASRAT